ncbi:MAG: lipoyl synthase [bacterium]
MSTPQERRADALRKPDWLKVKVPGGAQFNWIKERARTLRLHTVCEEARCPNIAECWRGGTATFMLMGDTCTRGCRFCSVKTLRNPPPLDPGEPENIAQTIREMGLEYVVLTSVNRDELPGQGADHFAETIRRTRLANPHLMIEVLIPDFQGETALLEQVLSARPTVLAHNVETVERLTPTVRDPRASFAQSISVLHHAKRFAPDIPTKSSLMLGLGETEPEILAAMRALRVIGVDFLTLGQYLQPDRRKLKVVEYIHPDVFARLETEGLEMGFQYVASGPLVRSSYRAAEFYIGRALQGRMPAPEPS